jgi:hypothetical protein
MDNGDVEKARGPTGIGGWLIVQILNFVLSTTSAAEFLVTHRHREDLERIKDIFNALDGSLLATPRLVDVVYAAHNCVSGVIAALCLYCIVKKKRAIVRFATAFYILFAAKGLIDVWAFRVVGAAYIRATPVNVELVNNVLIATGELVNNLMVGVAVALAGILYFHRSRRVKNTFVND